MNVHGPSNRGPHHPRLLRADAMPVEAEVDVSPRGVPGVPEATVAESVHRVERAIGNSDFQRPQSRVVINLEPHVDHDAAV